MKIRKIMTIMFFTMLLVNLCQTTNGAVSKNKSYTKNVKKNVASASSKKSNTTVPVVKPRAVITGISDINAQVYLNNSYILPKTVVAKYSDKSTKNVNISWDNNNVDTSTVKTLCFYGEVNGYSKKVKLTLFIVEKVVKKPPVVINFNKIDSGVSDEVFNSPDIANKTSINQMYKFENGQIKFAESSEINPHKTPQYTNKDENGNPFIYTIKDDNHENNIKELIKYFIDDERYVQTVIFGAKDRSVNLAYVTVYKEASEIDLMQYSFYYNSLRPGITNKNKEQTIFDMICIDMFADKFDGINKEFSQDETFKGAIRLLFGEEAANKLFDIILNDTNTILKDTDNQWKALGSVDLGDYTVNRNYFGNWQYHLEITKTK